MWLYLTQETQLATYASQVLGCLTLTLTLSKLTSPIAQLGCSTILSIVVASTHGHSDLPIVMLSLITGTIMIGALHGTSSRVTSNVMLSTQTVVALTIVAALLLIGDKPMAGTAVHADSPTQADSGYMHYKAFLLVSLIVLSAVELSMVSLGVANNQVRSGMVSLLVTTDYLLVALATGLALAPTAARTLINRVDSDSSSPTSTTVRDSSYACGMNANSPNAATSPNTTVMNATYTLCFVYAEILVLALISAYSPEHSGLPMSPTYLLLAPLLLVVASTAGDNRSAVASSLTSSSTVGSSTVGTRVTLAQQTVGSIPNTVDDREDRQGTNAGRPHAPLPASRLTPSIVAPYSAPSSHPAPLTCLVPTTNQDRTVGRDLVGAQHGTSPDLPLTSHTTVR